MLHGQGCAGGEEFGLGDDRGGGVIKAVGVAIGADIGFFYYDGAAAFTNFELVRRGDDFGCRFFPRIFFFAHKQALSGNRESISSR